MLCRRFSIDLDTNIPMLLLYLFYLFGEGFYLGEDLLDFGEVGWGGELFG
jgi:hypothetical protein